VDSTLLGFLNPLALPFSTEFRLKLRNGSQHVKQQTARGIAGIDALVEHMQVDLFPDEDLGDLAQMPGRAGQPIQAGDH
jgi:hypothetical protein